jgi:hypothetical protein
MIASSHNSTVGTILFSRRAALHGAFSAPTHQVSSHWDFVKALWAHSLRFPQNATLDRPGEIQQLTSPPRILCFSTNQTKGFPSSTCGPQSPLDAAPVFGFSCKGLQSAHAKCIGPVQDQRPGKMKFKLKCKWWVPVHDMSGHTHSP